MSDARIYLAGHDGMVGSAMLRILKARGHTNLSYRPLAELDLTEQGRVREFFRAEKPEFVLLAEQVRTVVGFSGRIEYDTSQPDGTPRKLLDSSLLNGLGWKPAISLAEGLESAYSWFLTHHSEP